MNTTYEEEFRGKNATQNAPDEMESTGTNNIDEIGWVQQRSQEV